jgi:hypothetical protein
MRRAAFVLGFAIFIGVGCYAWQLGYRLAAPPMPSPPAGVVEAPITVDGGRVVQTWHRFGSVGHACPVSATEAFTADHVSVERTDPVTGVVVPFMWGDRGGNSGVAVWRWSDWRRDLAFVVSIDGQFAGGWFRIAKELPKVGEAVVIVGYDFDAGAVDKPVRARVLSVQAGHFTYDDTPGPGSSGSCVLNEAGEIVGINVWGFGGVGAGVLLAGDWSDVPKRFRQEGGR